MKWRIELGEGGTMRDTSRYCDALHYRQEIWTWWPALLRRARYFPAPAAPPAPPS